MKIGIGAKEDLKLVQAVRDSIGKDFKLMVDANHAYSLKDAIYVGKEKFTAKEKKKYEFILLKNSLKKLYNDKKIFKF